MNESQETVGTFVIARSDTAKFLELQEECLHQMPLLIETPIYEPEVGCIAPGGNTEISVTIGNMVVSSFMRKLGGSVKFYAQIRKQPFGE
ncbi:MAG: hypothetical protein ACOX0K_09435 [Oscillospiraceae bacterium]|jgi:hypothetical protein